MFKKKKDTMVVVVFSNSVEDSKAKLTSILRDAKIRKGYELNVLDNSVDDVCTCLEVNSSNPKVFKGLVDFMNMEYAIVG